MTPVDFVIDEFLDVVDAGPVGLYEFEWFLHTEYPEATFQENVAVARIALERLLADGRFRVSWLRKWTDYTAVPAPWPAGTKEVDWQAPRENEPYPQIGWADDWPFVPATGSG